MNYNYNNKTISNILDNIQTNIIIIEDKGYDKEILDNIQSDFRVLYDCLTGLLLTDFEAYFGTFLINLKLKIDFYENTIAGVCYSDDGFLMCVNPLLLCKCKLSEIVFILCHEIYHLMLGHPSYNNKMNPTHNEQIHKKLNIAMDAEINDTLSGISRNKSLLSPPEFIITSNTIKDYCNNILVKSNEHFIYYYDLIKDNQELGKSPSVEEFKKMLKKLLGDSDSQNNNKYNNGNKTVITSKNYGEITLNDFKLGDGNPDFLDDELKALLNRVRDQILNSGRGIVPGCLEETLDALNSKPQITWKQILKKYLATIPSGYKRSPYRLNRRQPHRVDIRGKMSDVEVNLIIAVDTSASMSREMISKCFVEVFGMLKNHKSKITVIECDCEINRIYTAKDQNDIKLNVNGRGGTSFTPVFEYLNSHKEYRDGLLIYFTDGCGDEEIPKPILYRVMWVVTDDNELSVKNPYGEVVSIKTKDYQ